MVAACVRRAAAARTPSIFAEGCFNSNFEV
jgi:hypothetical protein